MQIFQFIMTYNFDRPETEIVCDLIYVANKYVIAPASVTFGDPKVQDPRPDIEEDPNTFIKATVKSNYDYRLTPANTGFLYTRLPLGAMRVRDDTVIIPPSIPFKTHDILPQINRQLGTRLTTKDVENTEYTTLDDDFRLTAKPLSKVWIGWRTLQVLGGGKKYLLYPDYMLSGFDTAPSILADKLAQLNAIANKDNRVSWKKVIDYDFGVMEVLPIPQAGRNTRIFIKAYRENYIDQWVYYTRIHPSTIDDQFPKGPPKIVIPRTPFTIYLILDRINQALNLHLTAEDVENTAYLPGLAKYTIKFKPTSYGWLQGDYVINVEYEAVLDLRLVGDGPYRSSGGNVARTYR